jgi:hypothetical protein
VGPDVGVAESINFVLMSLLMSTDHKTEDDVNCGRRGFLRGIGEGRRGTEQGRRMLLRR